MSLPLRLAPCRGAGFLAVALAPNGELYTVTQGFGEPSDNPQLARVDRVTGHVTPFGVNLKPENFMGLGFAPNGKLYGVPYYAGSRVVTYRSDLFKKAGLIVVSKPFQSGPALAQALIAQHSQQTFSPWLLQSRPWMHQPELPPA